jgi:hypothetical protein
MEKRKFSDIQCPLCKHKFKPTPRTLKAWKATLFEHLTVPPKHNLSPEQAKSEIAKYFKSLE